MRESGITSYRARWWTKVREGTAARIRWPWGAATSLAVPVLSGATGFALAALGNQSVDLDAVGIAILSAVFGLVIWYGVVAVVSMILAPSELAAADADVIRELEERVGQSDPLTPREIITLLDAHIDKGRPIARRLASQRRTTAPPALEADLAEAVYLARDWVRDGLALVAEHCIGRRQDFLPIWRSVPSDIRNGYEIPIAAAYARRRGGDLWVKQGTVVLRDCIAWLESRMGP